MQRDETITELIPFVRQIARQVSARRSIHSRHADDLFSDGCLGVIKAVDTYKAERGPLKPYVARRVEFEILDGIRSRTGVRNDERRGGLQRTMVETLSAEIVLGTADEPFDPVDATVLVEQRVDLLAVLDKLPAEQRTLLVERYGEGRTELDMARDRGMSRWHIKKALNKALDAAQRVAGVSSWPLLKNALPER